MIVLVIYSASLPLMICSWETGGVCVKECALRFVDASLGILAAEGRQQQKENGCTQGQLQEQVGAVDRQWQVFCFFCFAPN